MWVYEGLGGSILEHEKEIKEIDVSHDPDQAVVTDQNANVCAHFLFKKPHESGELLTFSSSSSSIKLEWQD
jgi:hypothetical protein